MLVEIDCPDCGSCVTIDVSVYEDDNCVVLDDDTYECLGCGKQFILESVFEINVREA